LWGDVDHLKVFANDDAADRWFEKNDAEGFAFEYPIKSSERGQTKHDRVL
jgi:hypothetical protein